jgi:hypothetical protein
MTVEGETRWEGLERALSDRSLGPLEVLREVTKYQRFLAAIEARAVSAARSHGDTWEQIAEVGGVTRQGAWKRWRTVVKATDMTLSVSRADVVALSIVGVVIRDFTDLESVGRALVPWTTVDVHVEPDDADLARRVFDFVAGLAYGRGARVEKVGARHLRLSIESGLGSPQVRA